MKHILVGNLAALGVLFSTQAFAQFGEPAEELPNKKLQKRGERIDGPITAIRTAGLLFASFDKNSDFSISQSELTKGSDRMFKAGDTDKSGSLSIIEIETWRTKALGSVDATPGRMLFDKDSDLRVTRTEFDGTLSDIFKTLDADKNGKVAFTEIVHVFEMPNRPVQIERSRDLNIPQQRRR